MSKNSEINKIVYLSSDDFKKLKVKLKKKSII